MVCEDLIILRVKISTWKFGHVLKLSMHVFANPVNIIFRAAPIQNDAYATSTALNVFCKTQSRQIPTRGESLDTMHSNS